MALPKNITFYYDEENLTVFELEKNAASQVIRAPVKTDGPPVSFPLGEDPIIGSLEKLMHSHQIRQIQGQNVYISLPMKDCILRSFTIPFVSSAEMAKIIKFEAKKYLPLDLEHLTLVYHTRAYMEAGKRRLRVIFFALRNELLGRYKIIVQQLKANASVCEPAQVSLTKVLLSKKEIKPEDRAAFLYLDKDSGYICFIAGGMPQFVRDFSINIPKDAEGLNDHVESYNRFILNEVVNSLGFYARKFNTEAIGQIIVASSSDLGQDLLNMLTHELSVGVKKSSFLGPEPGRIHNIEGAYAMGAGLAGMVADKALDHFNFFEDKTSASTSVVKGYKNVGVTLIVCLCLLAVVFGYFQISLKNIQKKYAALKLEQGALMNMTADDLQTEIAKNSKTLAGLKDIRTSSDVSSLLLRVASLLPKGTWLKNASVDYKGATAQDLHVSMQISGSVFKDDPNQEVSAVNDLVFAFKEDKVLSRFFSHVTRGPLNREQANDREVIAFSINFS